MKWEIEAKYDGMLLRSYLEEVVQLSKRLIKRAKHGEILVNGNLKTVRHVLQEGDMLEIKLPLKRSERMYVEEMPLQIVYEDNDIIIVYKEAGIATIPSQVHPSNTLANGLLYYYAQEDIHATVHVVTRLDKDTSGLVLIAKHPLSHSKLSDLQRENAIKRTYIAAVSGRVGKKEATINAPIGRKENSIIERTVTDKGQHAVTHFTLMEQCLSYAFVEVHLETGRTHQIRVHFSHIGHPLLGDDLYGGDLSLMKRQALHCAEIAFIHPMTKEEIVCKATLPKDMKDLLGKSV